MPYTTFYAKENYIKNNQNVIKSFNKALNKGIKFVKENNEIVIAETIKNQFSDLDIKDLEAIIKRYKDADSWYDNTFININDYDRLLDIMLYGKTINKKININDLITNDFN